MPKWATTRRHWTRKPYRRQYGQAASGQAKGSSSGGRGGLYKCARCHEPILPDQAWDLGHVDGDGLRDACQIRGYVWSGTWTRVS